MNRLAPILAAAALLAGTAVPAQADSKFSGVAPRSEHRSYHHDRYDRRAHRHRHDAYCRHEYRDRAPRRHYRNRHWRSDYDRYDRRYRYDRHYRRHHDYRRHGRYHRGHYGYRYGVRLGDGIYLTPDGLTFRLDFDD